MFPSTEKIIPAIRAVFSEKNAAENWDSYKIWKPTWNELHGEALLFEVFEADLLVRGEPEIGYFIVETAFALQIYLYVQLLVLRSTGNGFSSDVLALLKNNASEEIFDNAPSLGSYGWILGALGDDLIDVLAEECALLDTFLMSLSNRAAVDIFREPLERLLPQRMRHKSGAYFTPDWLASEILDKLIVGSPHEAFKLKYIEPCAGSGVFFVAAWARLRKMRNLKEMSRKDSFAFLSKSFFSIEKNPLTALAAKVNYVRCLLEFMPVKSIHKPCIHVYEMDCIDEVFYKAVHDNSVYKCSGKEKVGQVCDLKGKFDIVIGNPPWISWESLNVEYRARTSYIWQVLGLFSATGKSKAFSKEDISTLITYVAADYFLKESGRIAFVLPQSIFQSSLNSRGFRNFQIGYSSTPLKVILVQDFSRVRVFKGAAARTAVLYMQKGESTAFPVPYEKMEASSHLKNPSFDSLSKKMGHAYPSSLSEPNSPWIITDEKSQKSLDALSGKSAYRARAGVFTGGANAAFYLSDCILLDGLVHARNEPMRAKRKFIEQQIVLEADFVYPFIRGRDVSRWLASIDPGRAIILPHTPKTKMAPVSPDYLKKIAPRTLDYFESARFFLSGRKGLTAMDKANADKGFYAMLRVGDYTFAPYKVAWKYISSSFTCVVLESVALAGKILKPLIPQEKLMIVPFTDRNEAFFVCAVLSSRLVKNAVQARMISTQISARIIEDIAIPRFIPSDESHQLLSHLCAAGHDAARAFDHQLVDKLLKHIDGIVIPSFFKRQSSLS